MLFRIMSITSDVEVEKVAPVGNSPTFLTLSDMKQVMPLWLNLSMVRSESLAFDEYLHRLLQRHSLVKW